MTKELFAQTVVNGIPVLWTTAHSNQSRGVALWLPPFTRSKDDVKPALLSLSKAGFTAISLDPHQHGARAVEPANAMVQRVFGGFRHYMWPILGQTTFDAQRVLDWAQNELTDGPVVAGGHSMGGDIAVALAGLDARVTRVAAIVATADWNRPGMHSSANPNELVDQGTADASAQRFYDQLNPLTHIQQYERGPAISFECAVNDTHVPPDGALRFRDAFDRAYPDQAGQVRVVLHANADHGSGAEPRFFKACQAWLEAEPIRRHRHG